MQFSQIFSLLFSHTSFSCRNFEFSTSSPIFVNKFNPTVCIYDFCWICIFSFSGLLLLISWRSYCSSTGSMCRRGRIWIKRRIKGSSSWTNIIVAWSVHICTESTRSLSLICNLYLFNKISIHYEELSDLIQHFEEVYGQSHVRYQCFAGCHLGFEHSARL